MATSGTTNTTITGTEISMLAMNILMSQYGADISTLDPDDQALSLKLLNLHMKHTQRVGGFLWKRRVGYLFITQNQIEYTISLDGDHCTEGYQTTTLTAPVAVGQTTIYVESTTGMTTGDTCLLPLSSGMYQDVGITVVDGTTLELDTGAQESLEQSTRLYTYTTKISRPIRVYKAATRLYSDGSSLPIDRPITPLAFDDYHCGTPDKASSSEPVNWTYIPQRTQGKMYVRGITRTNNRIMMFTYQREIDDLFLGEQEIDYPSEWFLPLAFKLAFYLSFALEIDSQTRADISNEAEKLFNEINGSDVEAAPMEVYSTKY